MVRLLSNPSTPERDVHADEARALVELRFPALAPARIAPLGAGLDNVAFLVNDAWVVRFPRRAAAVGWLKAETRILPLLAPRLPLPVPVPTLVAESAGTYPWPFAGYRLLPGRTADRARLDDDGRARLAAPLGRFLAALHVVGPAEARRLGAEPDRLGRFDLAARARRAREGLARIAALGLGDHRAALAPALATGGSGRRGRPRWCTATCTRATYSWTVTARRAG